MCFRPVIPKRAENICPKCKKVNAPEAKICAYCGAKLELAPPPGQSGGAPPRPPGAPPPGQPGGAPPKPPAPKEPPKPPKEQ